jgi:hypothetical protein
MKRVELSRQSILRTPVILLALANLTLLAVRLWPWQNVMSLPGNGTTGVDPAVTLAAYIVLAFWIGTAREESSRKSLLSAAVLGVVAGLLLVAQVVIATRQAANDPSATPGRVQIGLLVGSALLLGIVGFRTARGGYTTGFSVVCAIWASMVACLMAVTAVLGETWLGPGIGESSDLWKDSEALALGSPAMQGLVHSLDTVSGFLLIGPIVGGIAGALFAVSTKPKKT